MCFGTQNKDIPQFDICLAGFPCQAFSLAGKRMLYKQFGNSVTVNVVEAIAKEIKGVLDNARQQK